jgi:hypothetical protein
MNFSDEDLRAARLTRLAEIKAECEKEYPKDFVFLKDIEGLIGMDTNAIKIRAVRMGIKIFIRNRTESKNKQALCVSSADAEKIIRAYYEN